MVNVYEFNVYNITSVGNDKIVTTLHLKSLTPREHCIIYYVRSGDITKESRK